MTRSIVETITAVLAQQGLACIEQISAHARESKLGALTSGEAVAGWEETLSALGIDPAQLWSHQAASLARIWNDQNLVLSTATASGKTLVFQAAVLSALKRSTDTHLIFYPQKALAADQKQRWQSALQRAGLSPDLVAEVNGDVPMHLREAAVADAQVLLVTPDVIHAWLMRRLADPDVQRFLSRLKFIVIDEAHALEGPFGSSVAFLLRRLLAACRRLNANAEPRFIAATGTIANPKQHLEALTGAMFEVVDDSQNGAPRASKTIIHVASAPLVRTMEAQAATLVSVLPRLLKDDAFILFADSRQGVERITRLVNHPNVLPYRSGYEAEDRHRIEEALRQGRLNGVISTSALELGIDIPQFVLGINLGLPMSRKAFHQRLGRIGRAKPGGFIIMAPETAFASLGTSLSEYFNDAVEPSH